MRRKRKSRILSVLLLLALFANTFVVQAEESTKSNMNELDIAEYRNVGIETLLQNVELEKVEDTYTDKNETTFIKTDENGIITEIVIKGDSEDALKQAPSFGGVELGLPAFSVDLFMQHANLVKLYADMYIEGTYEEKASDYVVYGQEENTYNSLTIKSKFLDAAESDKQVYEIVWKANGVTGENLIQYGYHDVNAEKNAAEEEALRAEYIFPDSDKKYLSEDEVRRATVEQMYIGRNEIFARHGYIFIDEMLQQHFGATSWYQGTTPGAEFQMEAVFNDFEMKNVELIKRIEDEVNGVNVSYDNSNNSEFVIPMGTYVNDELLEDRQALVAVNTETVDTYVIDILTMPESNMIHLYGSKVDYQTIEAYEEYTGIMVTLKWDSAREVTLTSHGEFSGMDASLFNELTNAHYSLAPGFW